MLSSICGRAAVAYLAVLLEVGEALVLKSAKDCVAKDDQDLVREGELDLKHKPVQRLCRSDRRCTASAASC